MWKVWKFDLNEPKTMILVLKIRMFKKITFVAVKYRFFYSDDLNTIVFDLRLWFCNVIFETQLEREREKVWVWVWVCDLYECVCVSILPWGRGIIEHFETSQNRVYWANI